MDIIYFQWVSNGLLDFDFVIVASNFRKAVTKTYLLSDSEVKFFFFLFNLLGVFMIGVQMLYKIIFIFKIYFLDFLY